jgi:hypothetical protein
MGDFRGRIESEAAITTSLERTALLLATVAGWLAPAPLPGLPPRRAIARVDDAHRAHTPAAAFGSPDELIARSA